MVTKLLSIYEIAYYILKFKTPQCSDPLKSFTKSAHIEQPFSIENYFGIIVYLFNEMLSIKNMENYP